jgi:hypothetical protein
VRLARTAADVADGLYLVIRTKESIVVTSASPLQTAARESLDALDELTRYDQLLAESWRRQLQAAKATAEQIAGGQGDPWALRSGRAQSDSWTLRSIRAVASTAASESALAAQFEARLLRLSDEQLQAARSDLEVSLASLRGRRVEAAGQLERATEELLAELRTDPAQGGCTAIALRTFRGQERLADDVAAALRAYADRIGRLLLDLAEAAHATVGAPAGGLLCTRELRVPPRSEIHGGPVGAPRRPRDALATATVRSMVLFRDRVTDQFDEAIETLRAHINRAAQCQARSEQAARDRSDELSRIARRMNQLAEELDWMLLDER